MPERGKNRALDRGLTATHACSHPTTQATLGILGSGHDRHHSGRRGRHHRHAGGRRPGLAHGAPAPSGQRPRDHHPERNRGAALRQGRVGSTSGSSSGARTATTRCCWSCTAGRAGPTRSSPCPCDPGNSTSPSSSGTTAGREDPGPQRQGRQRGDDLRASGGRRHRGHQVPAPAPGRRQGDPAGRVDGHPDRPAPGQAPPRPGPCPGGHRPVREHGRQRGPQVPADPGAAAGRRQQEGRGRPGEHRGRPCPLGPAGLEHQHGVGVPDQRAYAQPGPPAAVPPGVVVAALQPAGPRHPIPGVPVVHRPKCSPS